MKNNRYSKLLSGFLLMTGCLMAGFSLASCNDDPEFTRYVAEPQTEIGRKIVESTDLIASISVDSCYTLTKGLEATTIRYVSKKGHAMQMFFFVADLTQVKIEACTPFNKPALGSGFEPISKQMMRLDAQDNVIWAGINADFGSDAQQGPQGIFWFRGKMYKEEFNTTPPRPRSFFVIDKEGKAFAAGADKYKEVAAAGNIWDAVGGGPVLVESGKGIPVPDPNDLSVEPRTCVGVSKDGMKVYMMVVDGRIFSYSNGMSFDEMGKVMAAIGCEVAINLDGGGSSTYVIRTTPAFTDDRFRVLNWPTDGGGQERAVSNGLVVVAK